MHYLRILCERRGGLWVYADDLVFIGLVVVAVCVAIILTNRILGRVARAAHARKAGPEAEQRAKTFVSIFRGVAVTALLFFGLMAILRWYNVNLTPFLASAGVLSAILAFGAQSFIKDILAGFFILTEDQFAVGDVIEVCGVSGDVEEMSLRTTLLRDMNGCAHIVPNGQMGVVTNYTRGWSRVDLKVAVSREEDADRVIAVLREECERLAADADFGPLLNGEPRVLGLDTFDDASFTIRLLIKTKPGEQWRTRREFRRRVKARFDAEGIGAPYPYRVMTPASAAPQTRRRAGKS
jgi:small conductance mechanosensitive channel